MSLSGQRNFQDKAQRISGSLPLLKSFLSCEPDFVCLPTDAEPRFGRRTRIEIPLLFCVSSSVVGMMVLSSPSPQRLVLSDPAFVLTEDQLLACHASLTALLSVRLFVIEH